MHCARPVKPRTSKTRVNSGSRLSPPVTPATAPLVVEPASVSAGMPPLLLLMLDRQVVRAMQGKAPGAGRGLFSFRALSGKPVRVRQVPCGQCFDVPYCRLRPGVAVCPRCLDHGGLTMRKRSLLFLSLLV